MSFLKSYNCLCAFYKIQLNGDLATFPYDRCFANDKVCIMIEVNGRAKCTEYVRLGRPYVSMFWTSLDKIREEYEKKVEDTKQELVQVIVKLIHEKKILKQAKSRAKQKAACLLSKIDANKELEDPVKEDCPAADAYVNLSLAV